jgi:hypothetical protein
LFVFPQEQPPQLQRQETYSEAPIGIGGAPGVESNNVDPRQDIRLGDVIVGNSEGNYGKGRVIYLFFFLFFF